MSYNKVTMDKLSTVQIEDKITELEARAQQYFKRMQQNGAHHIAINFANTKSTLSAYRAALADRLEAQK